MVTPVATLQVGWKFCSTLLERGVVLSARSIVIGYTANQLRNVEIRLKRQRDR